MNPFKRADSFDWLLVDEDVREATDVTDDVWREPDSGSLILIPDYYAVDAVQSEDEATEFDGQELSNLPVPDVRDTGM